MLDLWVDSTSLFILIQEVVEVKLEEVLPVGKFLIKALLVPWALVAMTLLGLMAEPVEGDTMGEAEQAGMGELAAAGRVSLLE